jgi:hypothetical protein
VATDVCSRVSDVPLTQAVFDLPRRLRAAVDRGAYDIAVDLYADAAPLLRRYGYKASGRSSRLFLTLFFTTRASGPRGICFFSELLWTQKLCATQCSAA